ncbi:glycoside hydrolase family 28 protein [Uliginosibacterium sp. 31-16]|uniref:glycoside hydrolase family 28 protein n=1 Tax=Uliginosibacterium sp. 31-16 TaxID=3068315 RepID=UPI00273D96E7|nr:glycoside hydrolase family 28 protein [Uliginosibacterium sp. 31-16]MDP5239059.1 glycoside hydrolase family 28 protein [Uliginosibacterium sp. 31-16]
MLHTCRSYARSRLPGLLSGALMLAFPGFAAAAGAAPGALKVPALAYDDHSIVLVWQKPADYAKVVDYKVYQNGKLIGSARENVAKHSPAAPYMKAFYGAYQGRRHVQADLHNFTVEGLRPDTSYQFSVRAEHADGSLSAPSKVINQRTAKPSPRCDITQHGAVGDGKTLNTGAIQDTITACPAGGTVVIPKGVFKSGALFLKSDMTLEVSEGATLLGSERAEDYPVSLGYTLYTYSTTQRPPSLINALNRSQREAGALRNIRIVGKGSIDGNGWKRAAEASLRDESGRDIPQFVFGTNSTYKQLGILASAQVDGALAEGLSLNAAYSQRRSSLMTLRGVENLYIGGITGQNPAFHGIMVLEGRNVAVNGVKLETWDVNNADGLEFGNSEHITVFNSFFDTGDDCINFAAGTGEEAAKQEPQRDAWIFNNYIRRGHGAVVIGSHTGAWIEDILAEDNVVNLTWIGLRAKSNNINGGGGRRIVYRDNAHRDLQREGFIFTLEYSDVNLLLDYKPASKPGQFKDIQVLHNTVEFTPDWKPTPIPQGPKRELKVVDFKVLEVVGDMKTQSFHENITVDDLLLINTSSIKIDGLKNGVLRNVRFEGYQGKDEALSVKNAPGLKQDGVRLPATK